MSFVLVKQVKCVLIMQVLVARSDGSLSWGKVQKFSDGLYEVAVESGTSGVRAGLPVANKLYFPASYADVCRRMLTYADVCRLPTSSTSLLPLEKSWRSSEISSGNACT